MTTAIDLLQSADAFIVHDSPLLTSFEQEEDDFVSFVWTDGEDDYRISFTWDSMANAEITPSTITVVDNEGDPIEIQLFTLSGLDTAPNGMDQPRLNPGAFGFHLKPTLQGATVLNKRVLPTTTPLDTADPFFSIVNQPTPPLSSVA